MFLLLHYSSLPIRRIVPLKLSSLQQAKNMNEPPLHFPHRLQQIKGAV